MENIRQELSNVLGDMKILSNKVKEGKKAKEELVNLEIRYQELIRMEIENELS